MSVREQIVAILNEELDVEHRSMGREARGYDCIRTAGGFAVTELTFTYTNWRGENSVRTARPISIRFGVSEWHKEPQALMLAYDVKKREQREFAVRDMSAVGPAGVVFNLFEHHPLAWDAHYNYAYEPVEALAKMIFDEHFAVDNNGKRWIWVRGGNSTMQDRARDEARKQLRASGHNAESAAPTPARVGDHETGGAT